MNVKEYMSLNPVCAAETDTISTISKLMKDNHIGFVPVCDDTNSLCGIVTDRDIVLRCVACDKDASQTTVSDVMTKQVIKASSDMQVNDVIKEMKDNQVRRIPIVDNNQLAGVITLGDLAQDAQSIGGKEVSNTLECICDTDNNKNAE